MTSLTVSYLGGGELQVPVDRLGVTCDEVRRVVAADCDVELRQVRLLDGDRFLGDADEVYPSTTVQCVIRPVIPRAPRQWYTPDRYTVQHTIGTGSYASVCQGSDAATGRLVAIKRCTNIFDNLTDCKRVLRELAILQALEHECVIQLHDAYKPPQTPELHQAGLELNEIYMVMELCDTDMKRLVMTDVTLEQIHISTLTYNLLRGLKYLHSAGVYHRDMKPSNCLVNQDCSVKICDFNLSRAMGNPGLLEHPITSARTGSIGALRQLTRHVVTRWYRAPEVILLQQTYTEAIDVWSAGCILAELVQMLPGGPRIENRGPLFPGRHCPPMSPRPAGTDNNTDVDQLSVICDMLGTPPDELATRLDSESARRYLQSLAPRTGEGLQTRFSHYVDHNILQLIEGMLSFEPEDRMSVEEALAHSVFGGIRDQASETVAPAHLAFLFKDEMHSQVDDALQVELEQHYMELLQKIQGP